MRSIEPYFCLQMDVDAKNRPSGEFHLQSHSQYSCRKHRFSCLSKAIYVKRANKSFAVIETDVNKILSRQKHLVRSTATIL